MHPISPIQGKATRRPCRIAQATRISIQRRRTGIGTPMKNGGRRQTPTAAHAPSRLSA
ncbi:hypothetical protein N6G02_15040 [Cupriavidus gilardii]|uniref:hypothetical protein n=1 Tax=Cupriavidus gilardii TaxID=82541 RepID=UPI0021BFCB2D|nr:hypothetical protein [Cupriavidus gilardii]MCT9117450.1 hypothetical protein [Cupriavidus gilardii]